MSERTKEWLKDWSGAIGAAALALVMAWLAQQADKRYVQKEYYSADQNRIERQLNEIQSDIKVLLQKP